MMVGDWEFFPFVKEKKISFNSWVNSLLV
jgi:hypothetical protein